MPWSAAFPRDEAEGSPPRVLWVFATENPGTGAHHDRCWPIDVLSGTTVPTAVGLASEAALHGRYAALLGFAILDIPLFQRSEGHRQEG